MRLEHVESWWDDFKTWILSYRLKANGFDANSQTIDNVATATESHQAVPLGQMRSELQTATFAGELVGAIYNVSGTPKIFRDSDSDGEPEELTSAVAGLYFVGDASGAVLDTVTYPVNSIIRYTDAGTWFLDSDDGTLGTFDPTAAYANPGGSRSRLSYRFLTKSYPGHNIQYSDTDGWLAGEDIVWNSAYDVVDDDNVGRWQKDMKPAVPLGSNLIAGIYKLIKGFKTTTPGELEADIDEEYGLSWNGNKFRWNGLDTIFGYVAGAVKIIDGAITTALLAANAVTWEKLATAVQNIISAKLNTSDVQKYTNHNSNSIFLAGDWRHLLDHTTGVTFDGTTNQMVFTGDNGFHLVKLRIPVHADKIYKARIRISRGTVSGLCYIGADSLDSTFTSIQADASTQYNYFLLSGYEGSSTKETLTGAIAGYGEIGVSNHAKFDPGAVAFDLAISANNGGTGVTKIDWIEIEEISGAMHTHELGNGSTPGFSTNDYTSTEKTKLAGIATGATANDTDANLKNRANHTGTQTASTISDFNATVETVGDARYARTTRTATHTVSGYSGTGAYTISTALSPVPSSGTKVFMDYQRGVPFVSGDGYLTVNGSNQLELTVPDTWFVIKNGDVIRYWWEG